MVWSSFHFGNIVAFPELFLFTLLIDELGLDKFNEIYSHAKQMVHRSKPGKRESLGRELQMELKKINGGMDIGSLIEELVFYEST